MNEGIPQSLLQAMYSGVPVVGTDVGGIPEIISDGATGLLANPRDATSLAGAIIKLLEPKLKARLVESATTFVQENFKWNALGEKIEGLFRRELKRF